MDSCRTQPAAQIQAILTGFRRQQPLRAGSLLVTILGDAIAPRGGSIALASLIALARLFGINERLARTAVGRLANDDWVTSIRSGRSSYYTLSANGRGRFAEATHRIYSAPIDSWNGAWTLVILSGTLERKAREKLSDELRWLNFGEASSGVFARPTHAADTVREELAQLGANNQLIVFQGGAVERESEATLVARCWDLAELARRYRRFIAMFEPVDQAATVADISGAVGETAYVLRTLLLHEYRKIYLRDPLLPNRLLPAGWAGADALELCRRLYIKAFQISERYLSESVQTMSGRLPPPSPDIYQRFGGLPTSSLRL
ncbi:PaaX family transcriptional regulator [Steroidobacter agaridevorans]|uniref:PaaX family transcriptional regulator n=1 Tax=Steroidobacter agaridevorans TaxID=2695856 RepID=UPI0013226446|nr:PaaX family transcriptional regulator C-terminal domain-containing protein [Steroidobacter agaridevorans]GFE89854.1 phenylacetic acid degradation operon negative regulatory protein [Steroidobacter agaridevorans]